MKLNKKPLMFAAAVMGAAASSLSFAPHASAAAVPVPNFSFETTINGNQYGYGGLYTHTGGFSVVSGAAAGETPSNGSFVAVSYAAGNGLGAEIANNLGGYTTVANTVYTLTVAFGTANASFYGGAAPTYNLSILDNGVVVSTLTGLTDTLTTAGAMQDYSVAYAALTSGDALTVQFGQDAGAGVLQYGGGSYDNIRVNATAVPEPSTIALMLGGLGALALVRRMRRTA